MVFTPLRTSEDTNRANWIAFLIGFIGCVINLVSSVFSIGEIQFPPNLMYFGHCQVLGVFGFRLLSVARSMFLDINTVVWGEVIYGYVEWKKRTTLTPEVNKSAISAEVLPSGGGVSSSNANSRNGNPDGTRMLAIKVMVMDSEVMGGSSDTRVCNRSGRARFTPLDRPDRFRVGKYSKVNRSDRFENEMDPTRVPGSGMKREINFLPSYNIDSRFNCSY